MPVLILLSLLIDNLFSAEYMMTKMILEQSLKDVKSTSTNFHCDNSQFNFKEFDEQSFSAGIKCQYKCKNKETEQSEVFDNFSTSNFNMQRGDGNLWASLTTTIHYWAQEECIHLAAVKCEGLDKIEDSQFTSISSGEWKMGNKLGCSKDQVPVFSPFESSQKIVSKDMSFKKLERNSDFLKLRQDWTKNFRYGSKASDFGDIKNCNRVVDVTFCYGDCLAQIGNEEWKEYLATNVPLGSDEFKFCADDLHQSIAEKGLSPSISTHLCETKILYQLKSSSALGLTCASSRISTNCNTVMK